jgi:hypothetical protein
MTDLIDRADSGDIHRPIGEDRIFIHRRDTTGEDTQNLGKYFRPDAPFGYLRKTINIDDTVVYMPETIGLAGPQDPPPPLPPQPVPPKYDMTATVDGELAPAGPGEVTERLLLRKSVPYVIPADARRWSRARHAKTIPPWVVRLAIAAGVVVLAGAYAGLVLAAVVVFR